MKKKIFVLFILVCFCMSLVPAFAAYKAASEKEKKSPPPAKEIQTTNFQVLRLEFDDYLGKEIYLKCRMYLWAQDSYIVTDGYDIMLVENYLKNFKPKQNDEVLIKVKVLKRDYVQYLKVLEGTVVVPASQIATKKGLITTTFSDPYQVLTLVVSPGEKYEITGDLVNKIRECIGSKVVIEGKIRSTSYNVFDKSLDALKFEVVK